MWSRPCNCLSSRGLRGIGGPSARFGLPQPSPGYIRALHCRQRRAGAPASVAAPLDWGTAVRSCGARIGPCRDAGARLHLACRESGRANLRMLDPSVYPRRRQVLLPS
eukprot:scaffold84_cov388-Prasinococcus_capsulatus_cf.AAC.7